MTKLIHRLFLSLWYSKNRPHYLLVPLSLLYCVLVTARRQLYLRGVLQSNKPPVPVIVVGNISVGGTGKTPLIINLAKLLTEEGYSVGILCSGYKGKNPIWPVKVTAASRADAVGDEALLLAMRTVCPVVAGRDRVAGAEMLYAMGCNLLLSDDGMQHYGLRRDIEILTLNEKQGKYNKFCLPAGPFRESYSRLNTVDFIVTNAEVISTMTHWNILREIDSIRKLSNDDILLSIEELQSSPIHAIAGIGDPNNFFEMLESYGLTIIRHPYPDHFLLSVSDFEFNDTFPIVMTEKDAVKYLGIENDRCWVIRLGIKLDAGFYSKLLAAIKAVIPGENIE